MELTLWQQCQGNQHIKPLKCTAWRMVEAQHISSTRKLVDTLEEHEILEDLIENIKPPLSDDVKQYHYLLFTPFRYPPLAHGSRFGQRFEPSLWYGSLKLSTVLAEVAFYRFYFISGCEADLGCIELSMTAFAVDIATECGVELTQAPFLRFKDDISAPDQYAVSQALGTEMRNSNVQAFSYFSARSKQIVTNIGLFAVDAFNSKNPRGDCMQTWQCFTTRERVEFVRSASVEHESEVFELQSFLLGGHFPVPKFF